MRPLRGAVVQSLNVRQTVCARAVGRRACRPATRDRPAPCAPGRRNRSSLRARRPAPRAADNLAGRCSRCRPAARPGNAPACTLSHGVDLPPDADERIFGRLVAVDRREDRRPLDVRIVVRAAAGDVDRATPRATSMRISSSGSVRSIAADRRPQRRSRIRTAETSRNPSAGRSRGSSRTARSRTRSAARRS